MPWSIIDVRLVDVALKFDDDPDRAILQAFRMLEDQVRARTDIQEHGARLFQRAFGSNCPMHWSRKDTGEEVGRLNLFIGAYQAFRNPRAHRSVRATTQGALAEFLLVNQLFRLEGEAVDRVSSQDEKDG